MFDWIGDCSDWHHSFSRLSFLIKKLYVNLNKYSIWWSLLPLLHLYSFKKVHDGFQAKISPMILFSGMYKKSFIYCRNGTTSQWRTRIYLSTWLVWLYMRLWLGGFHHLIHKTYQGVHKGTNINERYSRLGWSLMAIYFCPFAPPQSRENIGSSVHFTVMFCGGA